MSKFVTDFADQAVVLPVVVIVAIALAVSGRRRPAMMWLGVMFATLATVVVAKVGFLSCSPVFGPWGIQSPSGHVAAASVVAGGLISLLTGRRAIVLATAGFVAMVLGLSRLALGAHSMPEVLIGLIIGISGTTIISFCSGSISVRRPILLLSVTIFVAVLFHGVHLPAEAAIRRNAVHMLDLVPACRTHQDRQ